MEKPRTRYYEKACQLMKNENTSCFRIKKLLNEGQIAEGRIDFLKLPGFGHFLGNCERAILEFEGNFQLCDIVRKDGNNNLIKEATLRKN
jgi:hypothetical protein